jgi:carboxymethylenebutenolidase
MLGEVNVPDTLALEKETDMNIFQRYLAEEFAEDYQEGRLSRRDALKLIVSVTGSLLVANSILAACMPPPESLEPTEAQPSTSTPTAEQSATDSPMPEAAPTTASSSTSPYGTVMPDDPAIVAGPIAIPAPDMDLIGYLARPAIGSSSPVILVCHENRGLTPHIQDVTRRFAKAGYVGLAVDLLSRQGGTEVVGSENVPGTLGGIAPEQFVEDFKSGWRYLQGQPFAESGRVGMTGFCFGGGVTWQVAVHMPELLAAVPFYGPHPLSSDVPTIQSAILAMYGELDGRINSGIPEIEAAMSANNKIYEKVIYPNADHAFNNDTGSRFNPEAARDAWERSLAWFEKYVRNA